MAPAVERRISSVSAAHSETVARQKAIVVQNHPTAMLDVKPHLALAHSPRPPSDLLGSPNINNSCCSFCHHHLLRRSKSIHPNRLNHSLRSWHRRHIYCRLPHPPPPGPSSSSFDVAENNSNNDSATPSLTIGWRQTKPLMHPRTVRSRPRQQLYRRI
jgi:hypothetical protein